MLYVFIVFWIVLETVMLYCDPVVMLCSVSIVSIVPIVSVFRTTDGN